ncbi:CgeB family protein [Romboutsia sp. Marseille-P6047]|uniref:CgeB family protein n=1 Tax=Romboutsia sp. Marseille-P6047 TaxID=2161817 RepID=UPI000F056C46|nr:glycosyltransferase [Romboutsia sp. Marseille-P6047]
MYINIYIDDELNIKVKSPNESIRLLKVACVFDSFTMKCYESIVDLIPISYNGWKDEISKNKPDIFFVESAWNGIYNTWNNKLSNRKHDVDENLKSIIQWCNYNNVPTVFWNKEDPVHYNNFLDVAKLFDYVFTTDEDSISKYKVDLNHENIYTLPFAANPKIHNPIKLQDKRIDKSCFAGSYYRNRYKERREDLKKLFNLAIEYTDLDIYDRNYKFNNPITRFPSIFNDYIKGYLDVDNIYKANKGYKISLNVNSVKNSPTMFSRRVFECLASGTPIISSYSLGINNLFSGLVVASDKEDELREEFIRLKDDNYYYDKVVRGIREVLKNHTYQKRLSFILDKIGINIIRKNISLGILSRIDTLEEYKTLKDIYLKQTYKYKKLYILTQNKLLYDFLLKMNEIVVIYCDKNNMKKDIKSLLDTDYIGFINTKNIYGDFYFEDLMIGRLYSNAEIIGKCSFYEINKSGSLNLVNENMDFRYVDNLDLDKCIIKKEILNCNKLEEIIKYIDNNEIDDIDYTYFSIDKNNLTKIK